MDLLTRALAGLALLIAGCGGSSVTDGGPPGGIDARPGDAGAVTGDPATGPSRGMNLICGGASFPPSAILYQDISAATVDPESAMIMAALDASNWADSGARQSLGIDLSFEVNCADPDVPRREYAQFVSSQPDCDLAPVPLVPGGRTEGSDSYACDGGDCHLLVYQGTRLYELYQANVTGGTATGGTFTGTCLAIWDLSQNPWDPANLSPTYSRGDACDGGNAADLPIAPMLLTKQELAAALAGDGIIHHALRFTMVNSRIRSSAYVHPATHYGFLGTTGGPDTLPTGARLRLRGDFPLASLPNDAARVIVRTLQHYGMFLSDGGNIFISATTDAVDLVKNSAVGALRPRDFVMVGGGRRIGRRTYSCPHVPIRD